MKIEPLPLIESSQKLKCTDPEMGALIDLYGYDFLLETLDLNDAAFLQVYGRPALNNLSRQQLKLAVISHLQVCFACQETTKTNRSLDQMIDTFLAEEVVAKEQ